MRSRWSVLSMIAALMLAPSPALAQRGRRNPEVDRAVAALASADEAEVRSAIESLGVLGDPRAVEPIAARIRRGLPLPLLEAALDALTVLARPEAGAIFFELARHRRPGIRLKAVQGIALSRP